MEEWKEYRLGELVELKNGIAFKSGEFVVSGIPVIKIKNVKPNRILLDDLSYISEESAQNKKCFDLLPSDILITMTGNRKDGGADSWVGKVALFNQNGRYMLNQRVSAIRVKRKDVVDYHFLAYLLSCWDAQLYFVNHSNSSGGQANISPDVVYDYNITLPPLSTQNQIAAILSSLDDKIEENRKINENLDQQAQTLFKSWFVDFEPFKNGEFVESELGMIPKGWRVGSLFDVAEIFDKKRKPLSGKERENMDKIYPYYGATSCMDYVDNYLFDGIYTLIGEDGSVAKENGFPYMQYVWGKFWVNNHAHILQGKNGFSTEMIHVFLSMTNIQHLVTGAVQAKLSQANMQKISLPIPPKDIVDNIRPRINVMYEKKRILEQESRRLAEIRDTLLPKLMSGELIVNEIDDIL
ncbi:restriction endonuclease subunit S [uncultured Prevotella sp.]|uniref:restriction endonuclease subunit S n=1 Tax=uncultured Prevotella sp. TaxID=159272 RepID=UPI0025D61247|nr:restriction endonuclease subunit S [uncultured Prevotella sp.]